MVSNLDSTKLAEDLIAFQGMPNKTTIVKRFPSPEGLVIVNPFILEFTNRDSPLKIAVSFDEYPSSSFPRVIFRHVPNCSLHSAFPHPNIAINSGVLDIRPQVGRPCIQVTHSVQFIEFILAHPLHYTGACQRAYQPATQRTESQPRQTIQLNSLEKEPPKDNSFMEKIKDLGIIFSVIQTGLAIGKTFLALIGL